MTIALSPGVAGTLMGIPVLKKTTGPFFITQPRTAQNRLAGRWVLAMHEPKLFLRWFVFTNRSEPDPACPGRSRNSEQPFPIDDRPHLGVLTDLWRDNPLLAIRKYRQAMVTWWAAATEVWDALSHDLHLIVAQGKRLDDVVGSEDTGDGLLGRAKFILQRIPMARFLGADAEIYNESIVFPKTHSVIQAIPMGGDIIRQRTLAGIDSDECAFQDDFEDAYLAASATIRSGGWFRAMSTADLTDGGFFKRLVLDLPDPNN
jgi:hypothetical protein